MKRLANYTDQELLAMGGKVGPQKGRISAGRRIQAVVTAIKVRRTNHLPERRELFAVQREPEK